MSTAPDPVGLVRSFLDAIRPHAEKLPEPFGAESNSAGQKGPAVPVRVHGLLAQLAEQDRDITRRFAWQQGSMLQQHISTRLSNTTVYYSRLIGLHGTEEADRSSSREQWYCGLAPTDRTAFDDHCYAVSEKVVSPLLPQDLSTCLRGPLARLALEYAAVVRRFAARKGDMVKSLSNSGLGNQGVVESMIQGLEKVEAEARSRLEGRWFRELSPEQRAAFDGTDRKAPGTPPVGGTGVAGPKRGTVNQRMLAILERQPEAIGWSAEDWAGKLGCQKSTVHGTDAWRNRIMPARALAKADAMQKAERRGRSRER